MSKQNDNQNYLNRPTYLNTLKKILKILLLDQREMFQLLLNNLTEVDLRAASYADQIYPVVQIHGRHDYWLRPDLNFIGVKISRFDALSV
jgi:hypothetical protein